LFPPRADNNFCLAKRGYQDDYRNLLKRIEWFEKFCKRCANASLSQNRGY
jgi:hypothetical protein